MLIKLNYELLFNQIEFEIASTNFKISLSEYRPNLIS